MGSLAGEFEGLVLSGKNAGRDHEDDYLSLNKTTGKKKGRGKKKGGLKINEKSSAPTSKTSVRGIKVKGFNAADLSAVDDAFPSLPGAHPKKDTGAAQQTKVSD